MRIFSEKEVTYKDKVYNFIIQIGGKNEQ